MSTGEKAVGGTDPPRGPFQSRSQSVLLWSPSVVPGHSNTTTRQLQDCSVLRPHHPTSAHGFPPMKTTRFYCCSILSAIGSLCDSGGPLGSTPHVLISRTVMGSRSHISPKLCSPSPVCSLMLCSPQSPQSGTCCQLAF